MARRKTAIRRGGVQKLQAAEENQSSPGNKKVEEEIGANRQPVEERRPAGIAHGEEAALKRVGEAQEDANKACATLAKKEKSAHSEKRGRKT